MDFHNIKKMYWSLSRKKWLMDYIETPVWINLFSLLAIWLTWITSFYGFHGRCRSTRGWVLHHYGIPLLVLTHPLTGLLTLFNRVWSALEFFVLFTGVLTWEARVQSIFCIRYFNFTVISIKLNFFSNPSNCYP